MKMSDNQQYFEEPYAYEKGTGGGRTRVWSSRSDWVHGTAKSSTSSSSSSSSTTTTTATTMKPATCGDSDVPPRDSTLAFWERGGVAFSAINGTDLPAAALARFEHDVKPGTPFTAIGVSIVMHPSNPWVPSVHCNVRFFHCGGIWWFVFRFCLLCCLISIQTFFQFAIIKRKVWWWN